MPLKDEPPSIAPVFAANRLALFQDFFGLRRAAATREGTVSATKCLDSGHTCQKFSWNIIMLRGTRGPADPERVENRFAVAFRDHDIVNRSGTRVSRDRPASKAASSRGHKAVRDPVKRATPPGADLTGLDRSAASQVLDRCCRTPMQFARHGIRSGPGFGEARGAAASEQHKRRPPP